MIWCYASESDGLDQSEIFLFFPPSERPHTPHRGHLIGWGLIFNFSCLTDAAVNYHAINTCCAGLSRYIQPSSDPFNPLQAKLVTYCFPFTCSDASFVGWQFSVCWCSQVFFLLLGDWFKSQVISCLNTKFMYVSLFNIHFQPTAFKAGLMLNEIFFILCVFERQLSPKLLLIVSPSKCPKAERFSRVLRSAKCFSVYGLSSLPCHAKSTRTHF